MCRLPEAGQAGGTGADGQAGPGGEAKAAEGGEQLRPVQGLEESLKASGIAVETLPADQR